MCCIPCFAEHTHFLSTTKICWQCVLALILYFLFPKFIVSIFNCTSNYFIKNSLLNIQYLFCTWGSANCILQFRFCMEKCVEFFFCSIVHIVENLWVRMFIFVCNLISHFALFLLWEDYSEENFSIPIVYVSRAPEMWCESPNYLPYPVTHMLDLMFSQQWLWRS